MRYNVIRSSIAALAIVAISGCGDDSTAPLPLAKPTLTITAPAATVYEADAAVFSAVYRDANDSIVPNAPVTWSVDDTTRALFGANGYLLALRSGTVNVTARSGTLSATHTLAIVRANVQAVTVMPTVPVLTRADVALIGVKVEGPGGRVLTGRLVTLTSDNPAVAIIDAAGRVRGVAPGVATIRATAENVSGTAQVQVTAGPTEFNLTHNSGVRLPMLIASDSVMYEGRREFHEVYMETGKLSFTTSPQLRYQVEVRAVEYNVTTVNGVRRLELRYIQKESDFGVVAFDARGDMQLTSEYTSPLHHVVMPVSGGMQMDYRIPGTDEHLQLFFRREPL